MCAAKRPDNGRQAYRITDQVLLSLSVPASMPTAAESGSGCFWLNELARLNRDTHLQLAEIADQNLALATVLQQFDHKLRVLSQAIQHANQAVPPTPQRIILSATGCAFGFDKPFLPNTKIILHLTLLPSYHSLSLSGQVIATATHGTDPNTDPQFPFWVRVKFIEVNPVEAQWLNRHILSKQTLAATTKAAENLET